MTSITHITGEGHVDWFLDNACPDHHTRGSSAHDRAQATAMRILEQSPDVAAHDLYTDIVCGNAEAVHRRLAFNPELARKNNGVATTRRSGTAGDDWLLDFGPKGWEALLYLCFTRLPLASSNDNAVQIAHALLTAGANPNVFFMAGGSQYTPLVGLIGEGEERRPPHPRRDDLVDVLLDAGADPFDNQLLYNIHFQDSFFWYVKLIHDRTRVTHAQAWSDPELDMLGMGGYGTGARFWLNYAIDHRNPELADWLLARGANANAVAPVPTNSFRPAQASLLEIAVRAGEGDIAVLLERAGAKRTHIRLSANEKFTAACLALDIATIKQMVAEIQST